MSLRDVEIPFVIFEDEKYPFVPGNGRSGDALGDGIGSDEVFGGDGAPRGGGVQSSVAATEEEEEWHGLYMYVLSVLLLGVGGRETEYTRDNGRPWEAKLRRSDRHFFKRMRMTPGSFDSLLSRMLPYLRVSGDGVVGRPPSIAPRIRLMVVIFWLGHGGSQFIACEAANMAESYFCPILREMICANLRARPPPRFPVPEAEQAAVAKGFVVRLGCRIQNVAGALDGCLVRISNPLAKYKAALNTRKCLYSMNFLAIVDSEKRFIWTREGL